MQLNNSRFYAVNELHRVIEALVDKNADCVNWLSISEVTIMLCITNSQHMHDGYGNLMYSCGYSRSRPVLLAYGLQICYSLVPSLPDPC